MRKRNKHQSAAIEELTEAIRLTAEYVGQMWLPAIPGWSWFDALTKYAPEKAEAFLVQPCTSAVIVKGEWFGCESQSGHSMPHGNSKIEAVWGEGEPTDSHLTACVVGSVNDS